VQESVGGGLCQLSSILYQCSITAGLLIIERYNHTVDIYQESERVAPLGADATVVYGYKDLRIFNNLSVPIQFHVSIDGELIECQLKAAHDLRNKELDYLRRVCENHIEVDTVDRLTGQLLAHSTYVRAPHS
jgi:vancomycin resistance protein VanW